MKTVHKVNCRACGKTHFGLWSQDGETVECPIEGTSVYIATGKVVEEVEPEVQPTVAEDWQPAKQEIDLSGMTVKELKALRAWEDVPDPKPTRKAEIIAAIEDALSS